jgi:hypothetical protein
MIITAVNALNDGFWSILIHDAITANACFSSDNQIPTENFSMLLSP